MRFSGWKITLWLGGALAALCVALLLRAQNPEEGVRAVLRLTARSSHFFLMLAFSARPLRELWQRAARRAPASGARRPRLDGASAWLLRNRRYHGNLLTVSHGLHLLAIVALPFVSDARYDAATLIGGGALMALIAALAATSSDAAVRALGKHWKRLHRVGIWILAVAFTLVFLPERLALENFAWPNAYGVGLGALAFGLRFAAWCTHPARRRTRAH